ncbi:MAG: hypothetical protein MUF85_01095 [Patescibacteria group bacterium]|jgi:hypothetical protein|nr:hypothetical protein [Patescibacteria group bacterium]
MKIIRQHRFLSSIFIVLFVFSMAIPNLFVTAYAKPTHTSPSYGVDEVFFGSGGVNDANSANYNARASLGDLGVGNSASSLYQAYGGFTTTDEPFLEFVVNASTVDLGVATNSNASTGSATFTVKAYLAEGYVVATTSDPPKNGTYTLAGMPTTDISSPGTEQFGINLRANTSPTNIGADPVQIPDASFSFGQVSNGYNTVNQFRYVKNEIIAFSNSSSGITQYTMTYLMNINETTPAGTYIMNHNLVATATY